MYIGSIELQIATMLKQDRVKGGEIYVCGFVPSYQLPNKMPWSLDPFLDPLITEIEDAFINGGHVCFKISVTLCYFTCGIGIQVDYKGTVAGISPGPAKIRCLLLCWTGDHPAQCEVGKFLGSGGLSACRRDQLQGMFTLMLCVNVYTVYRTTCRRLYSILLWELPLSLSLSMATESFE